LRTAAAQGVPDLGPSLAAARFRWRQLPARLVGLDCGKLARSARHRAGVARAGRARAAPPPRASPRHIALAPPSRVDRACRSTRSAAALAPLLLLASTTAVIPAAAAFTDWW